MVLGDVMDENFSILPLEEINALYNVNKYFLDYYSLKINDHIEFLEKPQDALPRNSSLNFLPNLDQKGVSNSYKKLLASKGNILVEVCENREKNVVWF